MALTTGISKTGRPATPAGRSGMTLVELLVVLAILGMVMGVLTTFFAQSTHIARETQARNEVRSKVRTVAEVVSQDLQLAGSSALASETGGNVKSGLVDCYADVDPRCITGASDNEFTNQDYVQVIYATSLRNTTEGQCRRVTYSFDPATAPDVLFRSDDKCSATGTNRAPFAENITKLQIVYLCADFDPAGGATNPLAAPVHMPSYCYLRGSFPRQVVVTVAGRADAAPHGEPITAEVSITTIMPNLKDE